MNEDLQLEIKRVLAAALEAQSEHVVDLQRRDELHLAETDRRDELHVAELVRRDELHVHELETFAAALESRDLIGQAKGVIMVSVGCSTDEAFLLLRQQSQHENRKLVEIAAEVVARVRKRPTSD
jgi:hypothetical protein